MLWANALADKSANDLLMAVRHHVLVTRDSCLADFSAAALVHVAWALARMLGQPSQLGTDLVLIIGEELEARRLETLPSRYVSTLMWSMARLGANSTKVVDAAHRWLATTDMRRLSAQSLVMSLWAMTSLSEVSSESLARAEAEMLRRGLHDFQPQELNAAVFAFSMSLAPLQLSRMRAASILLKRLPLPTWPFPTALLQRIALSHCTASSPPRSCLPRALRHWVSWALAGASPCLLDAAMLCPCCSARASLVAP